MQKCTKEWGMSTLTIKCLALAPLTLHFDLTAIAVLLSYETMADVARANHKSAEECYV